MIRLLKIDILSLIAFYYFCLPQLILVRAAIDLI